MTKASEELQNRLGMTDDEEGQFQAAVEYGMSWGVYGEGAGVILGMLTGLLVSIFIWKTTESIWYPNSSLPGWIWLTLVAALGIMFAIGQHVGGRIGQRVASKIQLRRLGMSNALTLPAFGWIAIVDNRLRAWTSKRLWSRKLRKEPVCDVSAVGWSIFASAMSARSGPQILTLTDPAGQSISLQTRPGSDVEIIGALLRAQDGTRERPIGGDG